MKEGSEGRREESAMGERVYGEAAGEGSEGAGREEVGGTVPAGRRLGGEKEKGRKWGKVTGVHGGARAGNEK